MQCRGCFDHNGIRDFREPISTTLELGSVPFASGTDSIDLMKGFSISLLALFICKLSWAQEPGSQQFRDLERLLGNRMWTSPEKRMVRATIYRIGSKGADSNSQARKGNEKVRLRYASEKEVGTVSAPSWLPRGSVVRMKGKQGYYVFVAADVGDSVEKGKAARKSGKNKEQGVPQCSISALNTNIGRTLCR